MHQTMTLEDVLGRDFGEKTRISCPFPGHEDSTPSAYIWADGHVHCYGCGQHANSLADLIRKREFPDLPVGVGLRMAERYAAKYLDGMPAANAPRPTPRQEDDPGPDSLTILAMTRFCDAARANLETRPAEAERIARQRGLSRPTALGIGLADMQLVRPVRRQLLDLGFGEDAVETALHHAGVLGTDRQGQTIYRLANRILVPEVRGEPRHVVYYQGRANSPLAKQKYLNPPIRNKPIFGWDSLARDTERVWIGEGPFDVLPLLEIGESAVSSMGANMNRRQTAAIALETRDREVIVIFDNDEAGRIGSARIVADLRTLGIAAHAAFPREGFKDFGEWAAAESVEGIVGEILWDVPA